MSSIHYKFRAELDYKTLQFDGLHIRGEQLVREICSKENLKLELFELQLQNAHTKKMYSDDELIPRNSSIIVQRFPRKDAAKVQKVQSGVNSGIVSVPDGSSSSLDASNHISTVDFESMDEAERLNHIRDQSTRAYDSSNFRRRPQGIMTGPPPPTYTCNRCYQPGHWYKNCPMLNTKRTTGIPSQELMETTADDPAAMLHPSGKYVVPIMHWKARQETLSKKNETESSSSPSQLDRKVPAELLCPLCHSIFKEAVVTSCCGNSYCADCIEQRIIDPECRKCPGTSCSNSEISIESLIPNRTLRDAAAAWHTLSAAGAPVIQTSQEPEQIRIRIGLKAPNVSAAQPQVPSNAVSPLGAMTSLSTVMPHHSIPITVMPQPLTGYNPAVSTLASSQTLIPSAESTANLPSLVQDVSLPPPNLRAELPGIPGVTTGAPGLPQFGQPPPIVPGVPGVSTALQQSSAALISTYGMHLFTPGFPPAASVLPRVPGSVMDEGWYQSLRSTDSLSKRGSERREHTKERERSRRKEKKDTRSRRRRDSSSSSPSSFSSSSVEEERIRRKRRDKETFKRRSIEKERQRRSERDRVRDRDRGRQRDRDGSRMKDMKAPSSRHRDRMPSSLYEERSREEKRKIESLAEDETEDGRKNKEVESKDEDEIDGIIAEYGNVQGTEDSIDLTKCDAKAAETPFLDSNVLTSSNIVAQSNVDEEETAVDEDVKDSTCEVREKPPSIINQTIETSEAEVVEVQQEKREDFLEQKSNSDSGEKEKEPSCSPKCTLDEDEKQNRKKHKKSKKSKKNHRKDDEIEENSEKKRKKHHRKHKKEKKPKKERFDVVEEDTTRKKRKEDDRKEKDRVKDTIDESNEDYRKSRKRERQNEKFDDDEPQVKNRKDEKDKKKSAKEKSAHDTEKERNNSKHEEVESTKKEKKEKNDENTVKRLEGTRRSVHERLQKRDKGSSSSSSSAKQSTFSGRKPVSFTVTSKSNPQIKPVSSSIIDQDVIDQPRKKDETDTESVSEAIKISRSSQSSGDTGSKHINTKIKYDL